MYTSPKWVKLLCKKNYWEAKKQMNKQKMPYKLKKSGENWLQDKKNVI